MRKIKTNKTKTQKQNKDRKQIERLFHTKNKKKQRKYV